MVKIPNIQRVSAYLMYLICGLMLMEMSFLPRTPGASNNHGDGAMTFYYNNDQGAHLSFYHDHAYGITRLNVYIGEAAGYLITDDVEADLIGGTNVTGVNPDLIKVLPDLGIPLVIQDKSFVDETTIAAQDPTWRWGNGDIVGGRREPKTGDLWVSSVYMPIQNPNDRRQCLWPLAIWPVVQSPHRQP